MNTIPKKTTLRFVKQQLKHKENAQVTLLTFKKDRKVILQKEQTLFKIIEAGYANETFSVLSEQEAFKLLKKLLEKEFPRSHQIYCQIV